MASDASRANTGLRSRVTVIIVNYHTTDDLERCVAAVDAQDIAPELMDIVVVDNASTGAHPVLQRIANGSWRHAVRVIANRVNRGYSGAINDGLAVSDADFVVFANVDVAPAPDAIRRCLEVLEADDRCGSVQPLLVRANPPTQPHNVGQRAEQSRRAAHKQGVGQQRDVGQPGVSHQQGVGQHQGVAQQQASVKPLVAGALIDTTGHLLTRARVIANRGEGQPVEDSPVAGQVFGVSGAFAVHRRAMLDEIAWRQSRHGAAGQVLTEALFAFFEDVELDWRARRFGWTAWFTPSAVVAHERGGRGARRSTAVEALNWANRLLVMRTCDDQRALRRAAVHYVATSVLLLGRMVARRPTAVLPALARWLRGRRTAAQRAEELDDRACLSAAEVLAQWEQPFSWRRWLRAWATRTR